MTVWRKKEEEGEKRRKGGGGVQEEKRLHAFEESESHHQATRPGGILRGFVTFKIRWGPVPIPVSPLARRGPCPKSEGDNAWSMERGGEVVQRSSRFKRAPKQL